MRRVRRNRTLRRLGAHREGRRIDVGEHGFQSRDARDLGNHPERQRGDDDLGAGRKVEGLQDEVEAHAPVLGGDRADVAAAEELRELLFEGGDVGTVDELTFCAALADDLFPFGNHPRAESGDGGHWNP